MRGRWWSMKTFENRISKISKWSPLCFFAFLILVSSINATDRSTRISGMEELQWEKVMPGVWKASFGEDELNALDYANNPRVKAITELGDAPFPFNKKQTRCQLTESRASIRLPLDETEKIYGLGLEFCGINRRGNVYTLKVDHYGGVPGYTHAPVPFFVSSRGYGVLVNSSRRIKIHVGVGNRKDSKLPERIDRTTGKNWQARPLSDAVEASVLGNGLEVLVFCGDSPLEAVQRYNLYNGGGVLPPRWGRGFWHRLNTHSRDQDVINETEDFKRYNFPLDVIGLEPGWQSFAYPCSYDWDKTRFPDPKEFIKKLKTMGIQVNLWENPYVAPTSTLYNNIKAYTGSHTVWLGEVPDYTLPGAQEVLLKHHQKNHLDIGVCGYKFDEVDGYDFWLWPDHATFPSGHDAGQIRQLYGLILQDMFFDHFQRQNKRTYGLVRASYAGASSKGFVIYSDYYEHRGYVTALANCSLAGVLWTPEIRSANSAEEWVRRFQTVCFSPMMQLNAWASSKKPWSFPEVTDIVRDVIQLRTRLLPYIYTAFYEYNQKGIPPFRAMVLEDGYETEEVLTGGELFDSGNPYAEKRRIEVTDQYMMGPSILVAPVFTGQTERKVQLPQGNWYDFYTGELVGKEDNILIQTKLEQIPMFVKDGAIIPMMPPVNNLSLAKNLPLEVRHYGQKENAYFLYDDDGETFDYENGEFAQTELRVERDELGNFKGQVKHLNKKKFNYGKITWRWMTR